MSMRDGFRHSLVEAHTLLGEFLASEEALDVLAECGQWLSETFTSGGKVLIGGNGGSQADAMHFAEEWTGRFRADRRAYPALVLGGDPSHLSCVANDYGFDEVFARTVQAFCHSRDLVILLSTSGNSRNLVRAAEEAKAVGAKVVGFLGRGGGALAPLCDLVVMAPGQTSDRIQEIHMAALHILIEVVERDLGVA